MRSLKLSGRLCASPALQATEGPGQSRRGLGFRVLGLRVWSFGVLGFRVYSFGFGVYGLVFVCLWRGSFKGSWN